MLMPITGPQLKAHLENDTLSDTDYQTLADWIIGAITEADGRDRADSYKYWQVVRAAKCVAGFDGTVAITQADYASTWFQNWGDIVRERAPFWRGAPASSVTPPGGGTDMARAQLTQDSSTGVITLHETLADGTVNLYPVNVNELLTLIISEYSNQVITGQATQRFGPNLAFTRNHDGGGTPPTPTTHDMWVLYQATNVPTTLGTAIKVPSLTSSTQVTLPADANPGYLIVLQDPALGDVTRVVEQGFMVPLESSGGQVTKFTANIGGTPVEYWRSAARWKDVSAGTVIEVYR